MRYIGIAGCACHDLNAVLEDSGAATAPATLERPAHLHTGRDDAAAEIIITAYGSPKPKGSLRHIGHGRLIEQVAGSGTWRNDVADAARKTMGAQQALDGPVIVEIMVTVAKPKSAPKRRETWPITRASGDADKLARNVLDALVDGGVLVDDSRAIDVICRKRYPGQHADTLERPGAVIRVSPLGGAA